MYKTSGAVLLISALLIINCGAGTLDEKVNELVQVGNVSFDPEPPISTVTPTPSSSTTPPSTTKPKTTTTAPSTTTTPQPTTPTTTTTPQPTTTPSTTTPPPTTPSTTTTPQPTTPSSTTEKPSTTSTTAAPSTTPKPHPKPDVGVWSVNSTVNHSCIVVKMAAIIDLDVKIDNSTYIGQMFLPKDANVTGDCGNETQTMTLTWSYDVNVTDSLSLVFKKNNSKFDLDSLNLTVTLDKWHVVDGKNQVVTLVHQKKDFETPVTMSYKCDKMQKLNMTLPTSNVTIEGYVTISNVQFQAFGNMTDMKFASAKDCEPYETPDIVPIAVGCALIALIVFVLIGYLIGRRRNQARGYLSM